MVVCQTVALSSGICSTPKKNETPSRTNVATNYFINWRSNDGWWSWSLIGRGRGQTGTALTWPEPWAVSRDVCFLNFETTLAQTDKPTDTSALPHFRIKVHIRRQAGRVVNCLIVSAHISPSPMNTSCFVFNLLHQAMFLCRLVFDLRVTD